MVKMVAREVTVFLRKNVLFHLKYVTLSINYTSDYFFFLSFFFRYKIQIQVIPVIT